MQRQQQASSRHLGQKHEPRHSGTPSLTLAAAAEEAVKNQKNHNGTTTLSDVPHMVAAKMAPHVEAEWLGKLLDHLRAVLTEGIQGFGVLRSNHRGYRLYIIGFVS